MDRAIKPITASIGGVEIVVTESARRCIRRAARAAAVIDPEDDTDSDSYAAYGGWIDA